MVVDPYVSELPDVKALLKSAAISQLDHLIITHPDDSLLAGAEQLSKSMPVNYFYYPPLNPIPQKFATFLEELVKRKAKVRSLHRNQYVPLREAELVILHPTPFHREPTPSLAMKLIYRKSSVLFLGSVDPKAQDQILQIYRRGLQSHAIILSAAGTSSSMRDFIRGRIAIAPSPLEEERSVASSAPLYRLAQGAPIKLRCDGRKVEVIEASS